MQEINKIKVGGTERIKDKIGPDYRAVLLRKIYTQIDRLIHTNKPSNPKQTSKQ